MLTLGYGRSRAGLLVGTPRFSRVHHWAIRARGTARDRTSRRSARLLGVDGAPALSTTGASLPSGAASGQAHLLPRTSHCLDRKTSTTERRHISVSLYKRGRKYSISIWVDGVRHLKSTGTNNRREA